MESKKYSFQQNPEIASHKNQLIIKDKAFEAHRRNEQSNSAISHFFFSSILRYNLAQIYCSSQSATRILLLPEYYHFNLLNHQLCNPPFSMHYLIILLIYLFLFLVYSSFPSAF